MFYLFADIRGPVDSDTCDNFEKVKHIGSIDSRVVADMR